MRGIVSVLAGVGLCLLVVAAVPAPAASVAAPPAAQAQLPVIGVVDLGRLNTGYQGIQQLNADFQEFQRQQAAKLQDRMKTRMLSDTEQKEHMELSTVGAPTEANGKRIQELTTLSDKREQRLGELEKKQARTPDEQTEYDTLNKIYSSRLAELTKLQTDLEQAALGKRDELMKVIDESVNVAIRTVAEQKKLSIVLAKEAVRFGGADITDDVLAQLNLKPLPMPAPRAGSDATAVPAAAPAAASAAPKPPTPAATAPRGAPAK